jgi:hypothetical protein
MLYVGASLLAKDLREQARSHIGSFPVAAAAGCDYKMLMA